MSLFRSHLRSGNTLASALCDGTLPQPVLSSNKPLGIEHATWEYRKEKEHNDEDAEQDIWARKDLASNWYTSK